MTAESVFALAPVPSVLPAVSESVPPLFTIMLRETAVPMLPKALPWLVATPGSPRPNPAAHVPELTDRLPV